MKSKSFVILALAIIGAVFISGCLQQQSPPAATVTENNTVTENKSVAQNVENTSEALYLDLLPPVPKKVVFVVDMSTYQALKAEIDMFANDVSSDLTSSIKILAKNYNSSSEVKSSLIQEKNENGDFQGIIFIGDVPWAYLRTKGVDWQSPATSDSWYLDLEDKNTYTEKANADCGTKELKVTGSNCPASYFEIEEGAGFKSISRWGGRIMPPLGNAGRMELLKKYFDRNHDYRQGKIKYEGALIYGPDYELNALEVFGNGCTQSGECFSKAKTHFVEEFGITTEDKLTVIAAVSPEESTKDTYLSLQKRLHKFELVYAHGGPKSFDAGSGKSGSVKPPRVEYSDLVDNKPGALFSSFVSCGVGAVDIKDNLATAYVFEGNGLAAYAPSVVVFAFNPFAPGSKDLSNYILGAGGRLYEAFTTRHYFTILGDPTIRLNEPPNKGCKLAFNKTDIIFDLRITPKGLENSDQQPYKKHIKIKNIGTATCHIYSTADSIGQEGALDSAWGFNQLLDTGEPAELDKIDPGETVEYEITTGIHQYTSDSWDANQTIRISGTLIFVTNDPQYLKYILLKAVFTRVGPTDAATLEEMKKAVVEYTRTHPKGNYTGPPNEDPNANWTLCDWNSSWCS